MSIESAKPQAQRHLALSLLHIMKYTLNVKQAAESSTAYPPPRPPPPRGHSSCRFHKHIHLNYHPAPRTVSLWGTTRPTIPPESAAFSPSPSFFPVGGDSDSRRSHSTPQNKIATSGDRLVVTYGQPRTT